MGPYIFSPIADPGGTVQIRSSIDPRTLAIVRSVLGRVALAVTAGIIAGLVGGLYLGRLVQTLLFEVEPVSLLSIGLPVLCLACVALIAAWPPARRATRVDPAEALRMD
jgi:putative ABC transport system permease protein